MHRFQIDAQVIRKEVLAPMIYRFTLEAPEIAHNALPGQFIMVRMSQGNDPLLRRPFSIHQVTDRGTVQILFKVIGKGTQQLSTLDKGDRINIVGPLGNMFQYERKGGHCLVGGGVGIAPMLFLAQKLLQSKEQQDLKVIIGGRNKEEISELLLNFDQIGVEVVHATDDGSSGHHGFVTELLEKVLLQEKEKIWNVHCCGPHPMMAKIVSICDRQNWNCWVSMETMMACGIGACLGCTITSAREDEALNKKFLQVCKDGPVFKAENIQW